MSSLNSQEPSVTFLRYVQDHTKVRCIKAPEGIREADLNDTMIVNDVLVTGAGPFAYWNLYSSPSLIGESVHYHDLLQRVGPKSLNLNEPIDQVKKLEGDYAILANIWSYNFYHWFEELSRLLVLEETGFRGRYIVHGGHPFIVQSLAMIGIRSERILFYDGKNVILERAWFTHQISIESWTLRPKVFWKLRSALKDKIRTSSPIEKVFMIRGKQANNQRNIANLDEVTDLASRYDFSAIDPGSMPFAEQVELFSSARSIIGMHGAAFMNCMFMQRCSSVIEFFSPMYINYTTISIINLLGHRYCPIASYINGQYEHKDDAHVDIRVLHAALRHISMR